MALTFQGLSKTDIETGIISKLEIATQAGSPSYLDAGDFRDANIRFEAMTRPTDPAGTLRTYALRFTISFTLVQTKKTAELAAMAGTSGTGLFETDVQIKATYISGRVITLGSITAYPMRLVMNYDSGGEDESQYIECSGQTIEPITSVAAKVA